MPCRSKLEGFFVVRATGSTREADGRRGVARPCLDGPRAGAGREGRRAPSPNPSVGAVLVLGGQVVGEGRTAPAGGPHAEVVALAAAGSAARGATAYVTLEPCAHHGRTPPCADALVAAGVARVVFALRDPNPRVDGAGAARLAVAGIDVTAGCREPEARALYAPFARWITSGRPFVTAKWAMTLDGRIATRTGDSRWISGPAARLAAIACATPSTVSLSAPAPCGPTIRG
ncbi:MAG: bifunctional diaminohydroxyphosphoribosylaminopyrimidine deaminase/5-amino-6-(5-phosphoribosylamino)uracil reductase RibD [Anaerolineae bacterium]